MKYAYYEVAFSEEEKAQRLNELKTAAEGDAEYYSSYIDVKPEYGAMRSRRTAMKSLFAAARKGKIDVVVLSGYENLRMSEGLVYHTLLELIDMDVKIAVGSPENIKTGEKICEELYELQMSFLMEEMSVPLITYEKCYVRREFDKAWIYLEKDYEEKGIGKWSTFDRKMDFIDAVKEHQAEGFWLYRRDVDGWYPIADYQAEEMIEIFEVSYDTIGWNIGLDLQEND